MSYGPISPTFRQAARLRAEFSKAKALPTAGRAADPLELIVNLKTAKSIGVAFSDSFLLIADEVIE